MKINSKFFQDVKGDYSLSRLVGFICVCSALLFCGVILILSRADVMKAAEAIALVFASIAVPSLTFLFAQKKTEAKTEISAIENATVVSIQPTEPAV